MTYNKILIIRTDRLGDVILSTPVVEAVRKAYPDAHIAFMTRPYTKDVVIGNPYIDQVILYDKDFKHRSLPATILFALALRKQRFDLALVLHSTVRVNLIAYLAGIKRRVGYARKAAWLLTDKLPYIKSQGLKHEMQYTLDVAAAAGISFDDETLAPFLPVGSDSQDFAGNFLRQRGITDKDKLAAIHPSASCPSRRWPVKNFAELADKIIDTMNCKVIILAVGEDLKFAGEVKNNMKNAPLLAEDFTIPQTAALLKRCRFFVSTDTGPAHIASAQGVPCITIFGRKQPGLSPARWKPLGKDTVVLHKDAGCADCLAHNCKRHFACLKAVTVTEVLDAAKRFL